MQAFCEHILVVSVTLAQLPGWMHGLVILDWVDQTDKKINEQTNWTQPFATIRPMDDEHI